jgi:signal peptidase II
MLSFPRHNFRSAAALASFFLTVIFGLSFDLWSKNEAFDRLAIYHPGSTMVVDSRVYSFIPGWIDFTVTTNQGAVFGIGAGRRYFFICISIAAVILLTYFFAISGPQRLHQVILGMLLAGVLGNLYDRAVFGYVRDMVHALPGWHWPGTWAIPIVDYPGPSRAVFPWIFNVADSLLCVGVALMILHSFLHPRAKIEPPKTEPQ